MQITWLGHSGFRIEIADKILLIDPWLSDNPVFPKVAEDAAISGTDYILITHAHSDHSGDALRLSAATGAQIICIFELAEIWGAEGANVMGLGKGGTAKLGDVAVTLVNAVHSSALDQDGVRYGGGEAGFMISGEDHVIYVSGDTDIMADMDWMGDFHKPDIGILCTGGHFTMDMERAAYAANRYFNFSTVIPCHYKTFDLLEQSAEILIAALPNVAVIEPRVMVPIPL